MLNSAALAQNKIVTVGENLCIDLTVFIGCRKIIQRCALSRKLRGDFIAVACRTVYDDCENEKAMEFA